MNLNAYFKQLIGRSTIVKLLTGLDQYRESTDDPQDTVSLILEYIPLAVQGSEVTLQVRTQLAIRNTPLLKRHPYREDIGSITISTISDSLESWYILLAEAVADHLSSIPHSQTTNAVAHWLLPTFNSDDLKLALN